MAGGKLSTTIGRWAYNQRMAGNLAESLLDGTTLDFVGLAEVCERFGVSELYVFGSVARNEALPASDIDLLYVLAPGCHLGFSINRLEDELASLFGRRVDLVSKTSLHPGLRAVVLSEAKALHVA